MKTVYTFFKILDVYDLETIIKWNYKEEFPLKNTDLRKRRSRKISVYDTDEFFDIIKRIHVNVAKDLNIDPNTFDVNNTIVMTDIRTYSFNNMMQMMYKLYSGYVTWEDPIEVNGRKQYVILDKNKKKLGLIELIIEEDYHE